MKKNIIYAISLFVSMLFVSCSSHSKVLVFSTIMTDSSSITPAHKSTINRSEVVLGSSYGTTLFCVPLGSPSIEKAVKDAIKDQGPNCVGLAEVAVAYHVNSALIIFGDNCVKVSGYPIIKQSK